MYGKFKEQGVQIIGISLDDDIEDLRGFVNQEAIDWPQIFDGNDGRAPFRAYTT